MKIIHLSDYINDEQTFVNNILQIYDMLSFIKKDYEHFFKWYWSVAIPKLINKQMEFILAIDDFKIIGVIILKKELDERKICTLYVSDNYQNKGIGTCLLNESFKYLETTKPIITFSDYKLSMFQKIIDKYDWSIDEQVYKEYNKRYELKCNTKKH